MVKLDSPAVVPSWLIKAARGGLIDWLTPIINSSLKEGVIRVFLKKPSLDPKELGTYRFVSILGRDNQVGGGETIPVISGCH